MLKSKAICHDVQSWDRAASLILWLDFCYMMKVQMMRGQNDVIHLHAGVMWRTLFDTVTIK